jgi:hypothetical protein
LLNNRQGNNNRRRGRNNNQRPQGNNPGRNGETGNRIDNRARGNAPQLLEKYRTLARDAQTAGDRVLTEYYLQFADHYFRVVAETRSRFEEQQPRRYRDEWDESETGESSADPRTENEDHIDDDGGQDRGQDRGYDTARRQPRDQPPSRSDDPDDDERPEFRPRQERVPFEARLTGNRDRNERAPRDDRSSRPANPNREERFVREARPARPTTQTEVYATAPDAAQHGENAPLSFDSAALPPAIASAPAADGTPAPKKRGRPRKNVDAAAV